MKSLLLVLLLASAVVAQVDNKKKNTFDCVVTEIRDGKAVTICDSRNQSPECSPANNDVECLWSGLVIPLDSWPAEWPQPMKGRIVRAQWAEGHLRPVECKSEQMRGLYDRPPLNSGKRLDTGMDCSGPPSKFIQELLERIK